MDDELEQMLSKRRAPQARSDLAEQIVQRALAQEGRGVGALRRLNQLATVFRQNFVLPQPGVAFAVMLLLGVWLGMSFDDESMPVSYGDEELAYTFIIDEGLNAGEWL